MILAYLLLGVLANLIATPFMAAADATDRRSPARRADDRRRAVDPGDGADHEAPLLRPARAQGHLISARSAPSPARAARAAPCAAAATGRRRPRRSRRRCTVSVSRAAVALDRDLVVVLLRERALQARVDADVHEVVEQVLGLVLEAQDRAPSRPPRRRPAARPARARSSPIGCPWGQVSASPIAVSMRSSSVGDIACSSRSASSCTSSHGMPSTSVRKRSTRRWRLDDRARVVAARVGEDDASCPGCARCSRPSRGA